MLFTHPALHLPGKLCSRPLLAKLIQRNNPETGWHPIEQCFTFPGP